jgi:hypothetical protein
LSLHPYRSLPDKAYWRRAVAEPEMAAVDPVGVFELRIGPESRVATAGSCFAQHIARYLRNSGYNYYVAEKGHPILPASILEENNYGLFSARYGNIYTTRQLWQLFQRAYGQFTPEECAWQTGETVFVDPFRPTTQPGGYASEAELLADRQQHLAAVREMFETLDVFVFTLGLTECWRSKGDGAVYPVCPGVEGGTFDPELYEFYNQPVEDVISDLTAFAEGLAEKNGKAQIILTVSPVPLVATADPAAHVLSATTYSKAVLRVAAETLRKRFANIHYFPSYELITGAFNRGSYYAADLRNVLEDGVAHVMRLFMMHGTGGGADVLEPGKADAAPDIESGHLARAEQLVDVECDEVALDRD